MNPKIPSLHTGPKLGLRMQGACHHHIVLPAQRGTWQNVDASWPSRRCIAARGQSVAHTQHLKCQPGRMTRVWPARRGREELATQRLPEWPNQRLPQPLSVQAPAWSPWAEAPAPTHPKPALPPKGWMSRTATSDSLSGIPSSKAGDTSGSRADHNFRGGTDWLAGEDA